LLWGDDGKICQAHWVSFGRGVHATSSFARTASCCVERQVQSKVSEDVLGRFEEVNHWYCQSSQYHEHQYFRLMGAMLLQAQHLQILVLLLERPTDDSIEIAGGFTREVGAFLAENSPKANATVFERFRAVLNEGTISHRVQYMIEVLMQVRHPVVASSSRLWVR
jgi:hypothetical protein